MVKFSDMVLTISQSASDPRGHALYEAQNTPCTMLGLTFMTRGFLAETAAQDRLDCEKDEDEEGERP